MAWSRKTSRPKGRQLEVRQAPRLHSFVLSLLFYNNNCNDNGDVNDKSDGHGILARHVWGEVGRSAR